jgi:hypothetical protein
MLYKYYRYESPFSPQLIEDAHDPIRRELLLCSIQEGLVEPENMEVIRVLDILLTMYQKVNFKGKPKSILRQPKRKTVKFENVMIDGEIKKMKVIE